MNIAVIKIGMNFIWDNLNDVVGGIGEAKSVISLLSDTNKINIYSKIKEDKTINENIVVKNIENFKINNHDENVLLVFNGYPGFDKEIIHLHKKQSEIINNFKGNVYYIFIDPELPIRNIEDINITRKDIILVTSIYNILPAFCKINEFANIIDVNRIKYFPFEMYPLLNKKLEVKQKPEYDLMYMGSFRKGKRLEKILKYYSDIDNTHFFGRISEENIKNYVNKMPIFHGSVSYDNIKFEINNSLCHVVIGDSFYEGNIFTPRIYECINYSTVCFIDIDMDKEKKIFKNDFNYVSSKEELILKILILKNDLKFREQIIKEQYENVNFQKNEYSKLLKEIIK